MTGKTTIRKRWGNLRRWRLHKNRTVSVSVSFVASLRKIRTRLHLLSIPQSGGKNVETFIKGFCDNISHRGPDGVCVCVCVCVCVFSSHSFWTSSSLDVPAGVTQEEGHTGFFIHFLSAVRALIFLARRIQRFLSLVDREVEFCVLTI